METSVDVVEKAGSEINQKGLLAFVTTTLDVAIVFIVATSLWSSPRAMVGALAVAGGLVTVRVAWFFLGSSRKRTYILSRNTRFLITTVKAMAVGTVFFLWLLRATWKVHQHYPDLLPSVMGWIAFVIFLVILYAKGLPRARRTDSTSRGDWRTWA